ncbi:MAG: CoA transferase, partial [Rhodospirillales bacterium]|nr:CoA transferase [Rhodospirillales bacterium]
GREPAGPAQAPLHAFLEETFAERTQAEWVNWFAGRDICFAPVLDLKEAFDDPHLAARDMVVRGDDGASHLNLPIKFREEPGRIDTDVPALGQHSTAILREIGYDEAACAALVQGGVIRQSE